MLGAPETMWAQPTTTRARIPERPSRSFVYLDVSGSMNFVLSNLLHLLLPYVANKQAEAFQFSTDVKPLPFAELAQQLWVPENYPVRQGWMRSVVSPEFHFIEYERLPNELYRCTEDVRETDNLAKNSEMQPLVSLFRSLLLRFDPPKKAETN
jgi:hypothetical protein